MRRLLVIISLFALVLAALGVGVLAADWPFWQRAWRWHSVASSWPEHIPGVWRAVGQGGGKPFPPLDVTAVEAPALARLAERWPTQALLVARQDLPLAEHYGAGVDTRTLLQGRSLTAVVLAPLYGVARLAGVDLLDRPVGSLLPEWRGEARGEITPRQLLWQVSGLASPRFRPLNPFSDRARLASGPNFERAALGFAAGYPPGSHFEPSPANAQVLAVVLSRARNAKLSDLLERGLWQPLGAGRAQLALDRLGGDMAAHCCLAATARDWLRIAQLLADDGMVEANRVLPPGFVAEMSRATAVHPGYGLGLDVGSAESGETLLWSRAPGRLLLAIPERRLAAVWFADGALGGEAQAQLLAALELRQSQVNEQRQP